MEENKIMFELVRKQKWDEVIKYLKEYNEIDVNIRDNNNNYLITYAILFNKIDIVSLLIHKGSKLDVIDNDGKSVVYMAVKYNYNEILDLLLHFNKTHIGISLVDIQDKNGSIPLHYAISSKNTEAIEKLIDAGSNTNHLDNNGHNSLHLSIFSRDINICKLILRNNIDINSRTNTGETPLHIACNLELNKIALLLINNNASVNVQDFDHELTPLSYCINRNNHILTSILLKNHADPNIQDYYGNSPMHYSLIENNVEIFNQLVQSIYTKNIINVNLYNTDSKLPIHIVLDNTYSKTDHYLQFLIPYSNLNFQDNEGNTPLHGLAKYNLWNGYINKLKVKKLNIFIRNKYNKRPIDYIKENDYKQVLDLVSDSYLYLLRNKPYTWKNTWENMCKSEIFSDNMSKIELKEFDNIIKINTTEKTDVCKKMIVKKVLDSLLYKTNDASYPIRNDYANIQMNGNKPAQFCTFTGITLDVLIGIIYLLQKYKNICSTLTKNFVHNTDLCKYYKQLGVISDTKCEFLNFELVWVYHKLYLSDNFVNEFNLCIKKKATRFIVIPLGIELREGSHANMLIYDLKLNEIERFEPHGSNHPHKFNYNSSLLDTILQNRFSAINNKIKYIRPDQFLPKIGFQIFDSCESECKKIGDPKGFCALWSVWYTDMRIKYMDIPRDKLVILMVKQIKESNLSFKNVIRDFSINITSIRDKLLMDANLNINDWINDQYTTNQMNQVVNEIKKLI